MGESSKIMTVEKIPCPVCGSVDATFVEDLLVANQFRLYSSDNVVYENLLKTSGLTTESYGIWDCGNCHVKYSSPMEAPSGEWYSYTYNALQIHASDRWEFDHVLQRSKPDSAIGEIGCGTGVFLARCKRNDIHAKGIDFSPQSIEDCRQKGLVADVLDIGTGEIGLQSEMDVLASFHVIEHLENPNRIFDIANSWGKPYATLWVAVPSDRRIDRLVSLKHIFDEPPHHLTRWNRPSLREIGVRYGWELVELVYDQLGLRQRLYLVTIHSKVYRVVSRLTGRPKGWIDRCLRYSLYPWVLLTNGRNVKQLTGHSMLARYRRA